MILTRVSIRWAEISAATDGRTMDASARWPRFRPRSREFTPTGDRDGDRLREVGEINRRFDSTARQDSDDGVRVGVVAMFAATHVVTRTYIEKMLYLPMFRWQPSSFLRITDPFFPVCFSLVSEIKSRLLSVNTH